MFRKQRKLKVIHVQQQDDKSCGNACLAMVLDVDYATVCDELPAPVDDRALMRYVEDKGFSYIQQVNPTLAMGRVYIVTVPSLNLQGILHYVVIDTTNDRVVVYDPNRGRKDRKAYKTVDDDLVAWTNPIEILRFEDETTKEKST